MKWKRTIKTSVAIMSCSIFLFNFIGCQNFKKEKKEALEYLEDKYGKEFELNGNFKSVYGDEFYQSPEKDIEAWPKDNSKEVFTLRLYPEGYFKDNYQNITMKLYVDDYLYNMVKEYWSDSKTFVYLRLGLVEKKFENNEYLEFLTEGKVNIVLNIFIKYDDSINIDKESNKIKSFCDYFKDIGLNGQINIMYTSRYISENEVNYDLWDILKNEGVSQKECMIECGKYYYDKKEEITTEIIKKQLENDPWRKKDEGK